MCLGYRHMWDFLGTVCGARVPLWLCIQKKDKWARIHIESWDMCLGDQHMEREEGVKFLEIFCGAHCIQKNDKRARFQILRKLGHVSRVPTHGTRWGREIFWEFFVGPMFHCDSASQKRIKRQMTRKSWDMKSYFVTAPLYGYLISYIYISMDI